MIPDGVYVHPAGLCESTQVGARTRIWAFAHVMPGAVIGTDCNVCDHAFVEGGVHIGNGVTVKNGVALFDGVTIDDDVFVGPSATFTNVLRPRAGRKVPRDEFARTHVRRGVTIGANATIVCGTVVGEFAFVAAGAVVTRDVAAYGLVAGNPARRVGWVCQCARKLPPTLRCECGSRYELDDEGHNVRVM